jgi:hypothetical protein
MFLANGRGRYAKSRGPQPGAGPWVHEVVRLQSDDEVFRCFFDSLPRRLRM